MSSFRDFDNLSVFVSLSLCFLSILALLFRWHNSHKRARSVAPGPPAWPVLGHLHLFSNDRPFYQTLWSLAQRYGPIMQLQLGPVPDLVVSSSDLARECLTKYDKIFASRPTFAAGEILAYNHTAPGLDPFGPRWQKLRKIYTRELLSPAMIEKTKRIRSEEMSKMVRSLFDSCKLNKGDHTVVNMRSKLQELSFNLIMRMVTDGRFSGSPAESQRFWDMTKETGFLLGVFNLGDYNPILRWLDLQGWERAMKRVRRQWDEFLQRLVDEHRRDQRDTPSDFIDVLISSFGQEDDADFLVKAVALGILPAAAGTSTDAMEWGLAAMIKHPEMCKKAQEELDAKVGRHRMVEESDLPRLEYLEAIVKETLRLYPGGPLLLPHMSTEACRVGGYYVPAGARLLVNAWAIHRDPAAWERPFEFEPDRFMREAIDWRGKDLRFIPFGSGRRGCPGASLAMNVVGLSLGSLLQGFDWGADGVVDMSEASNAFEVIKADPLVAAIIPRLPPHLY